MQRTYRFIIAKKRLVKETEKAYVFNYSKLRGCTFSIPKSKVFGIGETVIPYNENHDEPALNMSVCSDFIAKHKFKKEVFPNLSPMNFYEV